MLKVGNLYFESSSESYYMITKIDDKRDEIRIVYLDELDDYLITQRVVLNKLLQSGEDKLVSEINVL